MVPLTALAIPIAVAAVVVFLASFVLHMLLEFWHRPDLDPLPDEDGVMNALRPFNLPPGNYAMPILRSTAGMRDPAFIEKMKQGPVAFLTVRRSGPPTMGTQLGLWFVYCLIVGVFAAYIAGRALPPGAEYLDVFRFAGTTAFAGYGLALMHESIWWGKKWGATIRSMIDALIYAALTAGVFGWLWPPAM